MNEEEIKAKAAALAELYAAKAAGKTLQFKGSDTPDDYGPDMDSDLSLWRVKPEPRRMWETHSSYARTYDKNDADDWRRQGLAVTEWMEVIPG